VDPGDLRGGRDGGAYGEGTERGQLSR